MSPKMFQGFSVLFCLAVGSILFQSCGRVTTSSFRGIGSPVEGMIPAIEVQEDSDVTRFQVVLRTEYVQQALTDPTTRIQFTYQTSPPPLAPAEKEPKADQGEKPEKPAPEKPVNEPKASNGSNGSHDPIVIEAASIREGRNVKLAPFSDLSGAKVRVSGRVGTIQFSVPSSRFKGGPWLKDLVRGELEISFASGKFRVLRKFEKLPESEIETFEAKVLEKLKESSKDTQEKPEIQEASSALQNADRVLSVTVFDAKPFAEIDHYGSWLISNLNSSFDAIWGKSCGIRLNVEKYSFYKKKGLGIPASLPAEVGPEFVELETKIHQAIGITKSKILVLTNVDIQWPAKRLSPASQAPLGYALSFANTKFEFYSQDLAVSPFSEGAVFLANTLSPSGLAHELGHILLGEKHEADPENLMYPVIGGTQVTPEQCERARETMRTRGL